MRKTLKTMTYLLLLSLAYQQLEAQGNPPFYYDIQQFKKQDSVSFPPANAILFVGSSSIKKWRDVQAYFPGEKIINRGFGGSELKDVIRFANEIIIPYHPRQIVIYAGENDLAASDTVTSHTVYSRAVTLFNIIRTAMPGVPIIYVSLKPSPSRQRLMPKMEDANQQIRNFLLSKKNAVFIDVYHKMLGKDGMPLPGIYETDNLHMNASGYAIWQKAIEPFLLKYKR